MHSIHPNARTTPAVRAEIARSSEPTGVLAQRYGVSTETIRKWRKRGAQDCQDHSSRPHKLPWKATRGGAGDRLRPAPGHRLPARRPHLRGHATSCRISTAKPSTASSRPRAWAACRRRSSASASSGTFKDYDLGFVHIDIKHLPKLQTANGERRKRYLYVAIDRCSRWVHLAVKDDETEPPARSPS